MKGLEVREIGSTLISFGLLMFNGCGGSDTSRVQPEPNGVSTDGASDVLSSTHPIAFTSDRASPDRPDIHLLALDGGVLTVTAVGGLHWPRWSPSGSSIAFREQIENTFAEVGLVDPDGTERVLLTAGEPSIFGDFPVNWTLDEARLAFASRRGPDATRILVVPRDGGASEELFVDDTIDRREIAWSNDGRRVAYPDYDRAAATHGDGISKDIWVADATNPSQAINLTQGRVHAPFEVHWSPDSRTIAFQAFARAADGSLEGVADHEAAGPYVPPDPETFIIDADTASLTRVTDDDADERGLAWSPDGTQLIVSSKRDGDSDLWLIPLDDPSQARNLIDDDDDPSEDLEPDWFPGSR